MTITTATFTTTCQLDELILVTDTLAADLDATILHTLEDLHTNTAMITFTLTADPAILVELEIDFGFNRI